MKKPIKAITVDPHLKTIMEIEIDGSLESLQHAIDDHNIEIVYLDNDNIMYVDSEGLFRENQQFFVYNNEGRKYPFAGKAVILGDDSNHGRSKSTKSTVTDIAAKVGFHTIAEIRGMDIVG